MKKDTFLEAREAYMNAVSEAIIYEVKFREANTGEHCYNDIISADSLEEAEIIAAEMAGDEMWAEVHELN